MSRPTSKHQQALKKANPPAPPAPFSSSESERYYGEVMTNLPEDSWRLMATRLTSLQIAENQVHMDKLNGAIAKEGIQIDGKPHPAISQLVKVQSTTTAMLSRLKALPSGDARELGRAAKFENSFASARERHDWDDLLA